MGNLMKWHEREQHSSVDPSKYFAMCENHLQLKYLKKWYYRGINSIINDIDKKTVNKIVAKMRAEGHVIPREKYFGMCSNESQTDYLAYWYASGKKPKLSFFQLKEDYNRAMQIIDVAIKAGHSPKEINL